jgi:hypothetical protein
MTITSAKTITVTRSSLSLSTLDVNDEATYFLLFDGFSEGGGRWDRKMVESPYTDGEYEVGKRLQNSEVLLGLAVKGATQTALDSAMAALINPTTGAFTAQYTYNVTVTIAGYARTWTCYAADWEIDWKGGWVDGVVPGTGPFYVPMALAIPRKPIPVAGAF